MCLCIIYILYNVSVYNIYYIYIYIYICIYMNKQTNNYTTMYHYF